MRCFRHRSLILTPAWASFNTAMIRLAHDSTVELLSQWCSFRGEVTDLSVPFQQHRTNILAKPISPRIALAPSFASLLEYSPLRGSLVLHASSLPSLPGAMRQTYIAVGIPTGGGSHVRQRFRSLYGTPRYGCICVYPPFVQLTPSRIYVADSTIGAGTVNANALRTGLLLSN